MGYYLVVDLKDQNESETQEIRSVDAIITIVRAADPRNIQTTDIEIDISPY